MSFIKSVKLKTGELIACEFKSDVKLNEIATRNVFIKLNNPIIYKSFQFLDPDTNQIVDTISMAPYNSISDDTEIVIHVDQIQSISTVRPAAQQRYIQFVSQLDKYNREGDRQLAAMQHEETEEAEDAVLNDPNVMMVWPTDNKLH
jgi:hypothetical protein